MTIRGVARRLALDGLSLGWQVSGRVETGLARPRVHLLYLHALPAEHEERFDRWVGELLAIHQPLTHSAAVARILHGAISTPAVCFSLDDGFRSCVRVGEILARHGVKACFFVPTDFIGTGTVEAARQFFGTATGVDEPAMTWSDVEGLMAAGHEVGSHTVTHPDLGRATPAQVEQEIEESAAVLRSRLGRCDHFAWPLGTFAHFSPAAARTVQRSGFASTSSAVRGAHSTTATNSSRLILRRDHLPAEWPHRHGRYLLARSSLRSDASDNDWPAEWAGAA